MYRIANELSPYDVYIASRMAFLEMVLSGITTVGEFHYLHNAVDGGRYDDANLLAKEVIRAANDLGLRIALLRVAYARAGFQREVNPRQARFIESADSYLENTASLLEHLNKNSGAAWAGVAPHSVRAVPLNYLKTVIQFAKERNLPVHMHVAEQPAEVSDCIEEYGRSPVALLETEGLLSDHFTAVHAIHVSSKAINALAQSRSRVCACPTTERNLGDGVVPVDRYFADGVPVSLGTDSQVQIDLFEDARELEYHLRLQRTERNVLAPQQDDDHSALAKTLFECATLNGAASLGFNGGDLHVGSPADFFTIDLDDPSVAGASSKDLLSLVVFSASRVAVKDVVVGGKRIVEAGQHALQEDVVSTFSSLQKKLWDQL
jgi:formimidoylglutamate deiminase